MTDTSPRMTRALAAEFIGTFALIFIGAGAAIALGVNHDPPVAFAHGLTILVFVAAFGDISGGHFNPGVTIGLATAGVFPGRRIRQGRAAGPSARPVLGHSIPFPRPSASVRPCG